MGRCSSERRNAPKVKPEEEKQSIAGSNGEDAEPEGDRKGLQGQSALEGLEGLQPTEFCILRH